MRFPYKSFLLPKPDPSTGLTFVARPIIPIGLTAGSASLTSVPYEALVDSGADWCPFHAEVGEALGLEIREGPARTFVGVEGTRATAFFHPVGLIVGGCRVGITAGFVEGFSFPFGLLGQAGFFDHFVVTMSRVVPSPYVEVASIQQLRRNP